MHTYRFFNSIAKFRTNRSYALFAILNGSDGLQILIADNGPAFPDELTPGYGVRSIYDKLDLLFPGNYEIHFTNRPEKMVTLNIHKLIKDESAI